MNDDTNAFLTPNQFTILLISAMSGVGSMYIPNAVIKYANQDGWISTILGSIYPLYMLLLANYIYKKFPKDNILVLSKKYLGSFLGSILNFIFITFFIFVLTSEFSGLSNIVIVYVVPFLKEYQIFLASLIPVVYIVYKGIKPIGKLCEVLFYTSIILIFILLGSLKYGNILNLMPVFGSGIINIIKASKETLFFYSGMETIFLIYPYFKDSDKFLKCGLASIFFVIFIYALSTFLAIYYLGPDVVSKFLWPVIQLSDSINISIINSFRYLFLSGFSLVIFRCLSIYYFSSSYGLSQLIKKVSLKKFSLILYPVTICLSLLYGTPVMRREYSGKIIALYTTFNLVYISLIAILISLKKGDNIEKK